MGKTFLTGKLESLGVTVVQHELGEDPNNPGLQLPPLLLGSIPATPDRNKNTVLVYSHYDVMPADPSKWRGNKDPFELDREEDVMYGRGATDDKGPVTGWLNVLEALKYTHNNNVEDYPVNIRFLFEGMEERGSTGLKDFIDEEANKGEQGFFGPVDCVCITDNYWLTTTTPALTYGARGTVYFIMTVTGAPDNLHSGLYGRMVHEPMTDVVKLLSKLVEPDGTITVPGVELLADPPTEAQRQEYKNMGYTPADLQRDINASVQLSDDGTELVMGRMQYPSLSIHDIQGTLDRDNSLATIIPNTITAKFSMRLVPSLTPEIAIQLVNTFLQKEFEKLNTKNTMTLDCPGYESAWIGDRSHPNFQSAAKAIITVYGNGASDYHFDYTREGGSVPASLFEGIRPGKKTNVLMLPMGQSNDGAHTNLEKLNVKNYIEGSRVFGEYLYQLSTANLQ
ncbi:hypothetical protein ID866_5309 [Astraeus odoratus]|nr:hypothetical protein ID866_5309 [Astraeus odoratus]